MVMDQDTKALIEQVASQAAKQAVHEMLVSLGIDLSDPIKVQKDFASIRDFRETMALIKNRGIIASVGLVITGLGTVFYLGLKAWMQDKFGVS